MPSICVAVFLCAHKVQFQNWKQTVGKEHIILSLKQTCKPYSSEELARSPHGSVREREKHNT